MSKLIIVLTFSCLFLIHSFFFTKVNVLNKVTAVKVKPGYAITEDDSTFIYRGNKYFILTNETFDETGSIVSALIAGDVGYSIYKQKDFEKYKNLLEEYSLSRRISISINDKKSISVNNQKINNVDIDNTNKKIYYTLRSNDTLYRISYR